MGCGASKTAVLPSEREDALPAEHPDLPAELSSGVSGHGSTTGSQATSSVFDDSGAERVAATGKPSTDPQHAPITPSVSPKPPSNPGGKVQAVQGVRRDSTGAASTMTNRDGVSITSTALDRGGSEVDMRGKMPGNGSGTPPGGEEARPAKAHGFSSERSVTGEGQAASSLSAAKSELDDGTSETESVHAFEEDAETGLEAGVIRHEPSVHMRTLSGNQQEVRGTSVHATAFGSAGTEDQGGTGVQQGLSSARRVSDDRMSMLSSATGMGGSGVPSEYGDVPGGAPPPSPYKRQQSHAFGALHDKEGETSKPLQPAADGGPVPDEAVVDGMMVTGTVEGQPSLPQRHARGAEGRLLKGAESFRIMRNTTRTRRDNVLPVDTFELHAYHAAKEGAGGPTSPAKFRPESGVLKSQEESDMISGSMDRTLLFGHLSTTERQRVIEAFTLVKHAAGETIMQEGVEGDCFFVLASGQAVVKQGGKRSGVLRPGAGFGELAMLYSEPRAASVTAMVPSTTWQLTRSVFRAIVVTSAARAHQQNIGFLKRVPLLQSLNSAQLSTLADALVPATFHDKECIVKQGEEGNVFYIVTEGMVRVVKRMKVTTTSATETDSDGTSTVGTLTSDVGALSSSGAPAEAIGLTEAQDGDDTDGPVEEVELMKLQTGAHFGEQSLLHNVKRQASVYAVGAVTCLYLVREDFTAILGSLKAAMEAAHSKRMVAEKVAALRATRSFVGMLALARKAGSVGRGESLVPTPALARGGSAQGTHSTRDSSAQRPADGGGGGGEGGKAASGPHPSAAHRTKRGSMDSIRGFRGKLGAARGPGLSLDLATSHHTIQEVKEGGEPEPVPGQPSMTRTVIPTAAFKPRGPATAPAASSADSGPVGFASTPGKPLQPPTAAASAAAGAGTDGNSSARAPPVASHKRETSGGPPSLAGAAAAAAGKAVPGLRAAVHSFRRVATDVTMDSLEFMAVLGEGAFGQVTLVKHRPTGKLYALKQMQKARIVKMKQQRNVLNEKSILMRVREHPYILNLVKTFNTADSLYLVLEFLQGGDLFGLMSRLGGRLEPFVAKYYAAVVTSVLGFLHRRNIVYRDLKPENLVLDAEGYLRVVDFGFAKYVPDKTYTLCGTPEYIAPEMITGKGHGKGVDYWALGVLIYEMFAGYSPFADHEGRDHRKIYKKILRGTFRWSSKITDDLAKDLIARLLEPSPSKRLGCLAGGEEDIRRHWWFKGFSWADLDAKTMPPPVRPGIQGKTDVSMFEDFKETPQATIVPYTDDGSGWDAEF